MAVLFYAATVTLLFSPVVFLGRSLQPPLYYPYGVTDQGAYGYEGRKPINTFNIDLGTPAYYEWPLNELVGQQYRQGELPLWNPYQGAGTPLAAQFSTRAFFPYQIVEDISPNWTWDFFILGRLWLAGLFTFLFLRLLGISRLVSLLGGVFYMFSGTFVWFINLEQLANMAMVTPVLLWTVEGMWHWRWGWGVAGTATAVALVLLGGQPEIAIYVLLLAALYAIYRIITMAAGQRLRMTGSMVLAGLLGLALSAPLLLLFFEFIPQSYTTHPPGGVMGVVSSPPASWSSLLFLPGLKSLPTYYRYFPDNGRWDFLGGYTGVLLPYLLLAGLTLNFIQVKSRWRQLLLFFSIFGVVVLLKNFGCPVVSWMGRLPLLDQSWSPRWAGPAWTFSLAVAGAVGLEVIRDVAQRTALRQRVARWWQGLGRIRLVILADIMLIPGILGARFLINQSFLLNTEQGGFFVSSAVLGVAVALVVMTAAMMLTWRYLRTGTGIGAFIGLALLELWFVIPQGYEPGDTMLRLLPLAIGLLTVLALAFRRYAWTISGVMVCLILSLVIDGTAEHGLPQRYDPFTVPPYVQYLKSQEGYYRVTGGNGVLMPNFASAMGIQDIRYINALTPGSYHDFRVQNLHSEPLYSRHSSSLWFTGNPELDVSRGGMEQRIIREFRYDLQENLPFYSLLGVKYILVPRSYQLEPGSDTDHRFPLIYEKEIRIYENPDVLPRTWITHDVKYATTYEEARKIIRQPGFDLRHEVVIEEPLPTGLSLVPAGGSTAEIAEYRSNRVMVKAQVAKTGMLVLSDVFYPGWQAEVDGVPAKIYCVDGLFRGVVVDKGSHIVIFRYSPMSFRVGVSLAAVALLVCLGLIGSTLKGHIQRARSNLKPGIGGHR